MPSLPVPHKQFQVPFRNLHPALRRLFLSALAPSLIFSLFRFFTAAADKSSWLEYVSAVLRFSFLPWWLLPLAAFVLQYGVYMAFLLLPTKEHSHPFLLWLLMAASAFFVTADTDSFWASCTSLATATLGFMVEMYIIMHGRNHYAVWPPPFNFRDTIKSADFWGVFLHPTLPGLAASGVLLLAAYELGLGLRAVLWLSAVLANEARYYYSCCRSGPVRALSAHDEALIRTQAKQQGLTLQQFSDIYLGMVRPSPLIITGTGEEPGSLKWRGCTADTLPCFGFAYVNHLGLNTPPCCADHLVDMAVRMNALCQELGIACWIDGGSLLGCLRHRFDLLPWEDDMDFGYFYKEPLRPGHPLVAEMQKRVEQMGLTFTIGDNGYIHVLYSRTPAFPYRAEVFRREPWRSFHFDLIPFTETTYLNRPALMRGGLSHVHNVEKMIYWPPQQVFPLKTTELRGHTIPCPADSDAYLRTLYNDWTRVSYTYIKAPEVQEARRAVDAVHLAHLPCFQSAARASRPSNSNDDSDSD